MKDFERVMGFLITMTAFGLMLQMGYFDNIFIVVGAVDAPNPILALKAYWWVFPLSGALFALMSVLSMDWLFARGDYSEDYPALTTYRETYPTLEKMAEFYEMAEKPVAVRQGEGSVTSLKCPECSAPLHFNGNRFTDCEYCGMEIQRD